MVEFINWESCVLLAPTSSNDKLSPSIDLPNGLILRAGLPDDLDDVRSFLYIHGGSGM